MNEPARPPAEAEPLSYERIALVDLLDRVLAGGVVVSGDIRLAVADVDLVRISLRVLVSSISGGFAEAVAGGPDDQS